MEIKKEQVQERGDEEGEVQDEDEEPEQEQEQEQEEQEQEEQEEEEDETNGALPGCEVTHPDKQTGPLLGTYRKCAKLRWARAAFAIYYRLTVHSGTPNGNTWRN